MQDQLVEVERNDVMMCGVKVEHLPDSLLWESHPTVEVGGGPSPSASSNPILLHPC
jgi:hypothetical protein